MIKVTIGNNVKRDAVIIERSTTLREALENAGLDYSRGGINLDGATLGPGDLDKSFEDMNIPEDGKCFLIQVVKADNA